MDLGLLAGIGLIIIWAIGALVLEAPGWIHLLLTVGVALVIYRIVVNDPTGRVGTRSGGTPPDA